MTSTPSNNVLSDILQMTGIMSEDEAAEQSETVQLQPRLETKTLKKGVFLSAKGEYFYIKITYCSNFFYNPNLILEYLTFKNLFRIVGGVGRQRFYLRTHTTSKFIY